MEEESKPPAEADGSIQYDPKAGVVTCTCNSCIQEAETGKLKIQGGC